MKRGVLQQAQKLLQYKGGLGAVQNSSIANYSTTLNGLAKFEVQQQSISNKFTPLSMQMLQNFSGTRPSLPQSLQMETSAKFDPLNMGAQKNMSTAVALKDPFADLPPPPGQPLERPNKGRISHGEAVKRVALPGLLATIALGIVFTSCQLYEYMEAELQMTDGIYGSGFYLATGFHGIHVMVGTLMLAVAAVRMYKGHFAPTHHQGFQLAAWYWHFVDVIWLFVLVSFYDF